MRTLFLIVSIMATVSLAQAQSDSDSGVNFVGVVRYDNNAPAQFIQVELWTDGETTWHTTVITDRAGRFKVGAPCMVIQYKVEAPGFRPVSGRTDISTLPCRALESITLHPKAGTKIPTTAPTDVLDARVAAIPAEAKQVFETGQSSIRAGDFAAAISPLQKAIELYPRYAEAYELLGLAQMETKQGPQAEASLTKAIQIEERMPQAQYLLGVLYAMTGRTDLAEKPMSRFVELDPQNPEAHFELAKVRFAMNNFADAEIHARKAIELNETNPGVHVVLAYALLRQKKPIPAKQEFEAFLRQAPKSPMADDVKNVIALIDARNQRNND